MIAYKFLRSDHTGVFTRFRWPLPDGAPGAWVEAPVVPCRSGSMPAAWPISRCGSAASRTADARPHAFRHAADQLADLDIRVVALSVDD